MGTSHQPPVSPPERQREGERHRLPPPTHHALSPEGHTVSNSKGLLEI